MANVKRNAKPSKKMVPYDAMIKNGAEMYEIGKKDGRAMLQSELQTLLRVPSLFAHDQLEEQVYGVDNG